MITARLDEVELQEGWSEVEPEVAFRFGRSGVASG
jgi:hypothetical protein